MKRVFKKALSFTLSTSLLLNFNVHAQSQLGATNLNPKKEVIESYAKLFQYKLQKRIEFYQNNVKNPNEYINEIVNTEDAKILQKYIAINNINHLPKINKTGAVYSFNYNDINVSFDSHSIVNGTVFINKKEYKISNGKTLSEKIDHISKFEAKYLVNSSLIESLFIPKANAIICGGFCVLTLVSAIGVGGYLVYEKAKKLLGEKEDYEVLNKIREDIKQKTVQCNEDLNNTLNYSTKSKYYRNDSPGNFDTFQVLKQFLKKDEYLDQAKIEEHLYSVMSEGKTKSKDKTCKSFAEDLKKNMSLQEKRFAEINGFTDSVCAEFKRLSECLEEFFHKHRSHQGRKNIINQRYNEESGTYNSSDSITK